MAKYGLGLSISDGQTLTIAEGMALPITNGGTPTPVVRPTGLVSLSAGGSFQAPVPIYPPEVEPAVKTFLRPRHFQRSGFGSSYQPPTPMILTPIGPQWPDPVGAWLPEETMFDRTAASDISLGVHSDILTSQMTFSVWLKASTYPTATSADNRAVFAQSLGVGKAYLIVYAINAGYALSAYAADGKYLSVKSDASYVQNDVGRWVNITCTGNGNNYSIYRNGELIASGTSGGAGNIVKGGTVYIGSVGTANPGVPQRYAGSMQFMKIWDCILTDEEILALYTAQLPTVTG